MIANLSKPNAKDGIYTAIETPPFTKRNDHSSMLDALGFLPQTPLIDPDTMSRTPDGAKKNWDWKTTWVWDYPTMAMTAARLGRPAGCGRECAYHERAKTRICPTATTIKINA
ncbi:MAG: hypothetical protein JO295_11345 [Verrucomicrobia bacterium]|nr:hypothetical protein [Verrucomicrobiota bacterium]